MQNLMTIGMKTIFIVVLLAGLMSCGTSTNTPSEGEAYVIAQQFVQQELPHPATAEFKTGNYQFEDMEGGEWIITSDVTANDADGVRMTAKWSAWVQYNGGDWMDKNNWTLKQFTWL